jgi:DNA-binding SARP family transcriptional activator
MAVRTPPQQLRIRLFGQPQFALGDEPFRFAGRPKTMPLLAHVLLHRSRPVSRASLAFLLWEDETEATARANLRRHLLHVAQALPESTEPWLLVETDSVQWNPDAPIWLDVDEFERLVTRADARADAVALYAGDLLENLDDEWLFLPRERLRTQYLRALDELVIEARSRRRFPAAIDYAQRILSAEPLREDAVRQLMAIRYESGDRAGALQTYERFVRLLRSEIDVDPMPETVALRDRIMRNADVANAARAQPPDPTAQPRVMLGFAGRTTEMEQLRALWSRAARGRGGLALVAGEAGIGKTRLVSELATRAEAEGGRVLWGTTAYPESSPYQALVEALRGAIGILAALDVDAAAVAALRPLLPELSDRRSDLPVLSAADPAREQTRLFEALEACLAAIARPRPVMLVLEDLHWAGSATIAALDFLARRLERHPILLVATYRDDETPKSLRSTRRNLQQDGLAQHVPVGRLSLDAVTEIVAGVIDAGQLDADRAEKLWAASEGSPLFLSELIRELVETGDDSTLPPTLQNVIASRVARLSDAAGSLLGIVSVIGPAFDIDVTREITGWDERQLLEGIDELLARHLVREAGRRMGFEYAFTHHLIRGAVYETLAAEARRVWHRRIARALEGLHADVDSLAGEIARHFELGGDEQPALPYYLRAARHAEALHAHDEALAILAHAQTFALPHDLHAEALLLAETIHRRTGNRAAQQADIDALEQLAQGDEELLRNVLHRKILLARSLGLRDDERAYIDALEILIRTADDDAWRGRLLACKAEHLALLNRFVEADAAAREALRIHDSLANVAAQVADLCLLVSVATHRGELEIAAAHLAQAQQLAESRGNPRLVADTLFAASGAALMVHDSTGCMKLARTAREQYALLGDRESEADALARIATVLARLGRHDEARAHNVEAAAIFEAINKRQGLAIAVLNLGLISCRMGVLGRAIAEFERAAELFRSIHDTRGQTVCAINLACLRLRRGETDQAKTDAQLALDLSRRMKHTVYEAEALANLGAAERDLGELDLAIEHMQLGLTRQLETGRVSDRANDLADLALAYHLKGDSTAACEAIGEMLTSVDGASDLSLWPQNLYWIAARVYRGAGRDDEWPRLLETAHRIMNERASVLSDPAERTAFFALPLNREIDDASAGRGWPDHAAQI